MLIYLLRHGQTEYNAQKRYQGQRDIPLSPEGAAQLRRQILTPMCLCFHPAAHQPDGAHPVPGGKACAGGRPERDVLWQL